MWIYRYRKTVFSSNWNLIDLSIKSFVLIVCLLDYWWIISNDNIIINVFKKWRERKKETLALIKSQKAAMFWIREGLFRSKISRSLAATLLPPGGLLLRLDYGIHLVIIFMGKDNVALCRNMVVLQYARKKSQ